MMHPALSSSRCPTCPLLFGFALLSASVQSKGLEHKGSLALILCGGRKASISHILVLIRTFFVSLAPCALEWYLPICLARSLLALRWREICDRELSQYRRLPMLAVWLFLCTFIVFRGCGGSLLLSVGPFCYQCWLRCVDLAEKGPTKELAK